MWDGIELREVAGTGCRRKNCGGGGTVLGVVVGWRKSSCFVFLHFPKRGEEAVTGHTNVFLFDKGTQQFSF